MEVIALSRFKVQNHIFRQKRQSIRDIGDEVRLSENES